ncbi:hypothetical protein LB504_012988 [Fusarium proliferatum]|nr:hypothetical protein LB504_012988 [Fusarium proliferatum]
MMSSTSSSSPASVFQARYLVPPDIQFDVTRRFLANEDPNKINHGQGTYRDNDGQPWVLPSVQMAKAKLGQFIHEYLPILGLAAFRDEVTRLLYKDTRAPKENRIASCQALSGTGALLLVGLALKRLSPAPGHIYITDPTWVNYRLMFTTIGYKVEKLPCYKDGAFDFEAHTGALSKATLGSPIVLYTCAYNPTGCDPSREEWKIIGRIIRERLLFPIFDLAYLGFNSEELDVELAVCLSMAKNMGLYDERIGLISFATSPVETARIAESVLQSVQRGTITATPIYGARVAAKVLSTPAIREQWDKDLVTISSRIAQMRKRAYSELVRLGTPGDWYFITKQTSMFTHLGISKTQVQHLEDKHRVFMVETSRLSVAGLNEGNVQSFAEALDETVTKVK